MKQTTLVAALEELHKADTIDFDFIDRFDQYVKETQRITAGLESIHHRIKLRNSIDLHDVKELEALEPGILSKNENTKLIRFTENGSKVGVVAALEAINWKSIGKWGIIGLILSAIGALIYRVIKGRRDEDPKAAAERAESIKKYGDNLRKMSQVAVDILINNQREEHQAMFDELENMNIDHRQKNSIPAGTIPLAVQKKTEDAEKEVTKQFNSNFNQSLKNGGFTMPPKLDVSKKYDQKDIDNIRAKLETLSIHMDDDQSPHLNEFALQRATKLGVKGVHLSNALKNPVEFAINGSRNFDDFDPKRLSLMVQLLDGIANSQGGKDSTAFSKASLLHAINLQMMEGLHKSSVTAASVVYELSKRVKDDPSKILEHAMSLVATSGSLGTNAEFPIAGTVAGRHRSMGAALMDFLESAAASKLWAPAKDIEEKYRSGDDFYPITDEMKDFIQRRLGRSENIEVDGSPASYNYAEFSAGTGSNSPRDKTTNSLKAVIRKHYNDPNDLTIGITEVRDSVSKILNARDAKEVTELSKAVTERLSNLEQSLTLIKARCSPPDGFLYWEKRTLEVMTKTASDAQYVESQLILFAMRHSASLDDYEKVIEKSTKYLQFAVELQVAKGIESYALKRYWEAARDSRGLTAGMESWEIVAGNEAINWKKLGKWGLIGIAVLAILNIANYISVRLRMRKLNSMVEGLSIEEHNVFVNAYNNSYSRGMPFDLALKDGGLALTFHRVNKRTSRDNERSESMYDDMNDPLNKINRPVIRDINAEEGAEIKQRKAAADEAARLTTQRLKELPKHIQDRVKVSPAANLPTEPATVLDEQVAKASNKTISEKISGASKDTKEKFLQLVKMIYGGDPGEDMEAILEGYQKESYCNNAPLLHALTNSGMIAKDMGKYSYIYGDNSHLRVRLAANSIHFAVQGSKAIAEYLEDVDALIAGTTNDLLKELLKVDKDSGFINACRQMNFSGGLTSSSDLAKIAAQMDAHAKTVASTGDGFKANKLQYSDVQYKQVKELDAILKGDVATLKIGKIDMSKSLEKISELEKKAQESGNAEAIAVAKEACSTITEIVSGIKAIEMASLSIITQASAGIQAYHTDMEYMLKVACTAREFMIMAERDITAKKGQ